MHTKQETPVARLFLSAAASLLCFACAGCGDSSKPEPESHTIATRQFVDARLNATVLSTPQAIAKATQQSFTDLGMDPGACHTTPQTATLATRNAAGDPVTVTVHAKDHEQSDVTIYVGPFGMRDFSEHLLDRIRLHLDEAAAKH